MDSSLITVRVSEYSFVDKCIPTKCRSRLWGSFLRDIGTYLHIRTDYSPRRAIGLDGEVNASAWIRPLAAIFSFAARKKLIRENPITLDVKFKPPVEPVHCYTEHQLSNLLLTADAEGYEGSSDQLLFLKFSGFLSEESCNVKWSQVDFKRRLIRYWNQKGKRWTDQPMDREFVEFVTELTHKYEPYLFRYRSSSGLNHATRRINKLLGHSASLNVHTIKTCVVGRWKSMGLDLLTISTLAHHRDIDTTRKHYDYFDTGRIFNGNGRRAPYKNR